MTVDLDCRIDNIANAMGIDLEPDQRSKLSTYATLLARWNEKINLVSRRSFENVVTDRLFDALLMWEGNRPWSGTSHLDIGSGGGLPGIDRHAEDIGRAS